MVRSPSELAPRLISLAGQAFQRVDRFAELALDPASSPERLGSEREALATDFGAVDLPLRFSSTGI